LIGYGFDFTKLIEETFYQKTYAQSLILGYALERSKLFLDGRCVVSCITAEDMERFGVTPKDMDGIVNQLRNIKDVHCAVFAYETEPQVFKISMRSDEKVDVAQIASCFGGGGHVRAAGCSMQGAFSECLKQLLPHIESQVICGKKGKKTDA